MITTLKKNYAELITSAWSLILLYFGIKSGYREGMILALILIAVISFFAWLSAFRRRRAINDTPTSRIASAAQGYVELSGIGRPPEDKPLTARLSGTPCLWVRWKVERKTGGKKGWKVIDEGESVDSFYIDDGSGRVVVDLEGAEILTQHRFTWIEGDHRKTEWLLRANEPIYALGDFKTLRLAPDTQGDVARLLEEWKKDQPALLKRFDLNGDGEISEREWLLARQAARREIAKKQRETPPKMESHVLSCPREDGRLYLLSNYDETGLARRYLYWAFFHFCLLFFALGALPWAARSLPPHW